MQDELSLDDVFPFKPEPVWIVYYGNGHYAGPTGNVVDTITEARRDWSWGLAVRHAERHGGMAIRCRIESLIRPLNVSTREHR